MSEDFRSERGSHVHDLSQEHARWLDHQGKDSEIENAPGGQHGWRAVREGESTKRRHGTDNKGLTRPWKTLRSSVFIE